MAHAPKSQDHILCSFNYKVSRADNKFSNKVVEGKNPVYRFIKAILQEYDYCKKKKKMIKKHFNKNLQKRQKDFK